MSSDLISVLIWIKMEHEIKFLQDLDTGNHLCQHLTVITRPALADMELSKEKQS